MKFNFIEKRKQEKEAIKRRKEEEKRQKEEQEKKLKKKQLTIGVVIFAVIMLICGIGALIEKNTDTAPALPSVESKVSESESSTPAVSIEKTDLGSSAPVEYKPQETASADTAPTSSSVTSFTLDTISAFSGTAYVPVNGNKPYFNDSDRTTSSFETYSSLDIHGRCGVAYANIGQDLMPTTERDSIGQVKPSGWHTVKYDCVDGKYLYNRCHLIGYQLTADNANTKNLITGTRYLNVDGMLPFENMVADYIKETGNHVLYRVTPVFDGNNLVATGVLMEALSVEDKGYGICFNVFCYNSQPGVSIDYATGESWLNGEAAAVTTTKPAATTQPAVTNPPTGQTYILNTSTHKFHYPSCSSVGQMNEANKKEHTGSRDDLIAQGYAPCGRCNP